jgi:hypothetical protein
MEEKRILKMLTLADLIEELGRRGYIAILIKFKDTEEEKLKEVV